jgi:hypothetical protein
MTDTELVARLEKLERDNRRLKRFGGAALVLVAGAALVAASYASTAQRNGTQDARNKISAREFDLLGPRGQVGVKISMHCSTSKDCFPGIDLYDPSGKMLTAMGAGVIDLYGENPKNAHTVLLNNGIQVEGNAPGDFGGPIANFGVNFLGSGASLTLSGKGGTSVELLGQSLLPGGEGGVLNLMGKNGNSVYLDSDRPLIEVAQGKGSYMDLGNTSLTVARTGATEQTSAASIVMIGNDKKHHVIWKAP